MKKCVARIAIYRKENPSAENSHTFAIEVIARRYRMAPYMAKLTCELSGTGALNHECA